MMPLDNSSTARAPHYPIHDFATFGQCKAKADRTTDSTSAEDCTDCYNNTKKPTSASSVTLKQTSTPSPSYPSANSWPGFGNRYTHSDDIHVPNAADTVKSPRAAICDFPSQQQKFGRRSYVFSSKMANDATIGVRQKKYESIIAWHEANCRPSTSKCEFTDGCLAAPVSKKKRRSVQDFRNGSPVMRSCGTPSVCSPSSTMLPTPSLTSGESSGNPPSNPSETPSGELLNPDDHIDVGDNPLRQMERMTQDSLFEPPLKLCRTSENGQPAKREQDRNAKLEKMRTLEQQIMYDKAKTEWDRMMHEHEAVKMVRGYMPPVMPACSSRPSVPTPYPCTFANQNGMLMQGPCRRPIYSQQMPQAEPSSSVANVPMSTPMMVSLPQAQGHNMPMSQPLRPSLNPSNCSMQYVQNVFVCCSVSPNTYTPQGYPPVNGAVPACFPSSLTSNSSNAPSQSRNYGMYHQGIRAMCPPEKLECELWHRQLPPTSADFDNRFPNQKVQYLTNGAVMDDKMLDAVVSTNAAMFA